MRKDRLNCTWYGNIFKSLRTYIEDNISRYLKRGTDAPKRISSPYILYLYTRRKNLNFSFNLATCNLTEACVEGIQGSGELFE